MTRCWKALVLIPLTGLALSGCLRYEGDVAVTPSAEVSGTLEFGVEKSVASFFGLTSLEDLQGSAQDNNDNSFCSDATATYTETDTEFVVSCSFRRVETKADDDVSVERQGDDVIFRFNYNADADAPADPDQEYGTLRVAIAMPGPITSIDNKKQGTVEKSSRNSVIISGRASSIFEVVVTASCSDGCSTPTLGPTKVDADSFSGGRVTSDTVLADRQQPYVIKRPITIGKGVGLTIRPGVTIVWEGSAGKPVFVNRGELAVKGTKKRPVIMEGVSRDNAVQERGTDASTSLKQVRFRD